MLLGADFLRAHRVYVAHSQRKLYFTYSGAPVFSVSPIEPAKPRQSPAYELGGERSVAAAGLKL